MDGEALGHLGQRPPDRVEQLLLDAGVDAAALGLGVGGGVEPGPAPGEPVGLVRLVPGPRRELAFEQRGEPRHRVVDPSAVDHALLGQLAAVDLADRRMRADRLVHQRLGEARLVALVVPEPPVAPHVDDDVAVELLPIFDRDLAREGHRFRIVAVDVEDRGLDTLGHVRRIGRGARELRAGREADLIVDDEMDAAAGVVAADPREAEAFPDDPLPRERGVAVDQDRERLAVALQIVGDGLDRTDLAQHHRVRRLEVRGVGDQRHMDLAPVELAVGRGAEMVFDVARALDVVGVAAAAGELVEDHAQRLGHDVGEHVQPPAVRHADHEFVDARRAAVFDDALERGDHALAAVEPEALGPDILAAEEPLPLLGLDHLVEDRLLARGGEVDRLVLALHPVLEEHALVDVGDMHVFQADAAAVVAAQDVDDLADRRPFDAQRAAEEDGTIEVGVREAVIFGLEVVG